MNIPLPQKTKVIKKQGNSAIFEIAGLYPGYGVTLGNSLRRVLLSSLEGAAITQVKIKGASHEFEVLDGILEDVVVILLNLKKVRFKFFADEEQTASLSVKGERAVTAKDFKTSGQLEVVNSDAHIATITKSSVNLDIEVKVEQGTGYQKSEDRNSEKSEVGALPLDAIFTPMEKVSFRVENMRVGDRTDFDRLTISVETDGSISPEEAMAKSTDALLKHFTVVMDGVTLSEPVVKKEVKKEKKAKKKAPAKKKETAIKKLATKKAEPKKVAKEKK